MSCSSLKHRFDELKAADNLDFNAAMALFADVKGSLEAHGMELQELRKTGNQQEIDHLQAHIRDGETMMNELKHMTLH